MSCYYPSLAVDFGVRKDGKHIIKFLPLRADYNIHDLRNKFCDDLLLLPCGKCLGCKFDKARDWATRCVLESQYHAQSCFVTLTYDEKHLPRDNKIHKSDFDKFIKSLRNCGIKLRFFGCSEYGIKNKRPHFHVILFGFRPDDLIFYNKSENGDFLYNSKFLEKIWNKGYVVVGDLTFESAGYVARYTTKKLDDDSNIYSSNRPGIGFQYLKDNAYKILEYGHVYGRFGSSITAPVPHYFNRFLCEWYPEEYARLKHKKIVSAFDKDVNSMINLRLDNLERLKIHQSRALDYKLKKIGRS